MLRQLYRRHVPLSTRQFLWSLRHGGRRPGTIKSTLVPQVANHALRPAQVHALEASNLLSKGSFAEALERAELAVREEPRLMKAHYDRLRILARMGRRDDAMSLARELLAEFPIDVALNRTAQSVGYFAEQLPVKAVFKAVGGAAPGERLAAATSAAEYFYFFEAFEEALHACDMGLAVAAYAKNKKAREQMLSRLEHWRALSLEGLNNYQAAADIHRTQILLGPKPAQSVASLARCILEQGRPRDAYHLSMLSTKNPLDDPAFTPLMMDILQASDRISDSYTLYRKRPVSRAIANFFGMDDPTSIDILSGKYKDKRALLLSEGGPGDELRFSGFYDELATYFGDLTITCDPRLALVLRRSFPHINFLPIDRWRREFERPVANRSKVADPALYHCVNNDVVEAGRDVDLVCSVLDTLLELRPNRCSFRQRERNLLAPDPIQVDRWAKLVGSRKPRLQIGISWRSMLRSVARNRHYLSASDLSQLADLKGVDFWSLQPEATADELAETYSTIGLRVPDGLNLVDDIEGQLAFCKHLDLIVAPFTTTGEMGGAVGARTLMIATTGNTIWRRSDDGSDLFSPKTTIVSADDLHDKKAAMQVTARAIQDVLFVNEGRLSAVQP